ncbi:MAG TPA: S8 family serine peptidase [Gemmatimonadales bacterium]|nr:S8 family serine peptidase [Gemmatimonadales bacterium]
MSRKTALPLTLLAATMWLIGCTDDHPLGPSTPAVPSFAAGEPDQQTLIPNQYIVVFNDDVASPAQVANGLAAAHGLTLRHTYRHTIKGFSAVFPPAAVVAIQRNPNVRYIEQNAYSYIDTHERLNAPRLTSFPTMVTADAAAAVGKFSPPSGLTATAASETLINLSWTDNNGDEAGFEVHRSTAGGSFVQIGPDLGVDAESYMDNAVVASTEYCYTVRTYKLNKRGMKQFSKFSNTACATTPGPPTAPAAPSNLSATAVASSQIDLAWTDNANNEDEFEIERCAGSGCSNFTFHDVVGANVTNYNDTNLPASSTFRYRVRATNAVAGPSEYSNSAEDTTFDTALPPDGDPDNLTATAVSSSQINLAWDDNSTNEDGFNIERCSGAGCSTFGQIDQVGANVTAYNDIGLGGSTLYRYRVQGSNGAGNSNYSNVAEATTEPAPAGCNDNGSHDALTDPGLWGIVKVKANLNPKWLSVRGNDPVLCGMQAEFYGIDTGVDSDHPDLNVVEIQCFLAGDPSCTGEDDHGHGSHTAGTAAAIDGGPAGGVVGMAPGAKIHGFKVCDALGQCPNDDIIAAIEALTARKNNNPNTAMVANMSLGTGLFEGPSPTMDQAVRRSVNAGVVYALAAGNGIFGACLFPLDAQLTSPAGVGDDDINGSSGSNGDTKRANGAITTTSSNPNDTDVDCNYGNPVTVAAPGEGIKSTWLNGGYATIAGTSMATPHSAGAAILVLQGNQNLMPTEVEQQIVNDLDNWTTNDLPNANGRLDARCLGSGDNSCAGDN